MSSYNPQTIEAKWRKYWSDEGLYKVDLQSDKPKYYHLCEFPYPSGNLHVGHWYAWAPNDIMARYKRMNGFNVLFPFGYDAFGLPAENAAIKRGLNPRDWTYDNMATMRAQVERMGTSVDFDKEVVTCDPSYYKWTQWIFTQMVEKGIAYQADSTVNWCPSCKTVLANEQVQNGECERCDNVVHQKNMKQWMLKITDYADQLHDDLDTVDWPHAIKQAQRQWIGRSEGAHIPFEIVVEGGGEVFEKVEVFTTRPDTLFGATYFVIAPEHEMVQRLHSSIKNVEDVETYIKQTNTKSELDRQMQKEKTGCELKGVYAINPANGEKIPVWIADYVLVHYGTGMVMAVPAHDERDFEFAKKFDLPIVQVVKSSEGNEIEMPFTEYGKATNSQEFDGQTSEEAKWNIARKVGGEKVKNYRIRDWVISRQRYWGCPIPIVHCEGCGAVPVPKEQLPVELPEVDNYLPHDDGKSPLAKATDWVQTSCPKCGGNAERETDTFDTFIDSSWYFLRYLDNKNNEEFAKKEVLQEWMPVEFYSGGAEHTTMHLLYSRFFVKAMRDCGLLDFDEPYIKRHNRGLIDGPDGKKMSKSRGNVVNPDEVVDVVGTDSVRMYLAFMGPYDVPANYPWDPNGVVGVRRFLEKVWRQADKLIDEDVQGLQTVVHKTIQKVSNDLPKQQYNTAIAQLMICVNTFDKAKKVGKDQFALILQLLAPFAPHITEELWMNALQNNQSIHVSEWPSYNEEFLIEESINLPVQFNGKMRGSIMVSPDASEEEVVTEIKNTESFTKWLEGKEVKKVIYVQGKIVNIVVG